MIKRQIKNLFASLLGNSFCINGIRYFNKNGLRILYYHRIAKSEEDVDVKNINMYIQCDAFEKQMGYLKNNYHPIAEAEIISIIEKKGIFPKNSVWVTFDDGYKDNYINVFPILKRLDIPATFFVTTGFINQQVVPSGKANYFMSWQEIRELCNNNFFIGGHTASHKLLSAMKLEDCKKDVYESKMEIEEKIHKKIYSFAYPNGKKNDIDFDEHPKILDKCGFKLAVTTLGGINHGDLRNRRFALRRMGISYEDNLNIFKLKVATGCFWQN